MKALLSMVGLIDSYFGKAKWVDKLWMKRVFARGKKAVFFLCFFLCWGLEKASAEPASPSRSKVVWIERPTAVQSFMVDRAAVHEMFTKALLAFTQKKNVAQAWHALGITAHDTVGIKISTEGGALFSTKRALVGAIVRGLKEAGVPPRQIIIWDKSRDQMERAQWPLHVAGEQMPLTTAVFPDTGWDGKQFYLNEVVGKLIYGDYQFIGKAEAPQVDLFRAAKESAEKAFPDSLVEESEAIPSPEDQTSNKSFFAKLLTQTCTKIINVPVLSDSHLTGLHGTMASLALGSLDNSRRFTGYPYYGNPAVAEIMEKDFIQKKVVLHVLDALIAQYAGGPFFYPQFSESIGALYLSQDPVAIDTLVLTRINQWRKERSIDLLEKEAGHIRTAAEYGLGEGEPRRMNLIRLQ